MTNAGSYAARRVVANSVAEVTSSTTFNPSTPYKVAVAWDTSTFRMCMNGGAVQSIASTGSIASLNTCRIMQFVSGVYTGWPDSWITKIVTYPTALSNVDLQVATSALS